MEVFVRFIIEDETGTYVNYDEVDLSVDITDLVQQRKEEAVQLLKGKDVHVLSREDEIAMNRLDQKYENLIEEREREELAKHCLGLSWEVIFSNRSIIDARKLIEANFKKLPPSKRAKAVEIAEEFLSQMLIGDDPQVSKWAELILNHLSEIKTEYKNKMKPALASSLMAKTPVLHLNLHGKYFDMIANGEKGEEYREIKPFYDRIFTSDGIKIKGKFYRADEVTICFSNGFAKDRRQMLFDLDRIAIREGKTQWGADNSTKYYCLVLGRKIWQGTALELKEAESITNLIGEIPF